MPLFFRSYLKCITFLASFETLNIPITYELFCNSPKEGMIKGLWKNHSHESMVCTGSCLRVGPPSSPMCFYSPKCLKPEKLFIPELAYCWDHFYFPILTGDTQLGGSPYLCLLKPRAWSHQQEDTFVVPSQSLCVLIQMGRRDCPYARRGVPPRCLWEFSPWGSWSIGREGGANRQTTLG